MGYCVRASHPAPEPETHVSPPSPTRAGSSLRLGLLLGLIGVTIFGITLPATRFPAVSIIASLPGERTASQRQVLQQCRRSHAAPAAVEHR